MLLALQEPAYEAGRMIGACITALIPLAGIGKCVEILRRPRVNGKCVTALLLVFVAWLTSALGTIATLLGGAAGPLGPVGAVLSLLSLVAALLVAVAGLATHDRTRHVQGRAQGIWAVVLSGLPLGALSVGVVLGLWRRDQTALVPDDSPAVVQRPEFNFELTYARPWASLDPKVVAPDATLALRRTRPEMLCMVIAELVGDAVDQAGMVELSMANLQSLAEVLERHDEPVQLGALTFTRVRSRVRLPQVPEVMAYEHWLLLQRGFAWQIIAWGAASERARLAGEVRTLVESFRVLDPTRDASGQGTLEDVARPTLGFATRLADQGWNAWPGLADDVPLADFGAQRVNEALVVAALRFDGAPPDLEALSAGLSASLGLEPPPRSRSRAWQPFDDAQGLEFTSERALDGRDWTYVLRIACGRGSAHLVAGWAASEGDLERVRRALDGVTLSEARGAAPSPGPAQRVARADVWNDAGLALFARGKLEPALAFFARAYEEGGDFAMLDNLAHTLASLGRFEEARQRLEPELAKFPDALELHLRHAHVLVGCGRAGESTTLVLDLIARGLDDEAAFLGWLGQLLEATSDAAGRGPLQSTDARRAVEAWLARHESLEVRRLQASIHFRDGELERARAILVPLSERYPEATTLLHDLGHVENALGQHARAAELAQRLLTREPEDGDALLVLAWSQMGRAWYRDAKQTFERAARARPDDEGAREGLRLASAALGQGDHMDVRTPLEPVAVPAALARAIEESVIAADFGQGEASAYLLQMTGYHFEPGRARRRTVTQRARALTADGAAQLSSVQVAFDPLDERVHPERVEVKDAQGAVVAEGALDDAYVSDPDLDGMADHGSLLQLPVPGLQPGRTLEWQVTFEERGTSETFGFERQLFTAPVPVALQVVFVRGDVSALKSELWNEAGVELLRGEDFVAWLVRTPPLSPDEPLAAWPERRCPMLWLSGETAGWEELAREYLAEIRDRLERDAQTAALSAELTTGLASEPEKIAALAGHVQREISYKAIEFGVRARRPNAATETLRLRYGDCKDQALLLHQLLAAAGIESQLALVSTRWSVAPALPSLEQFNHMVVHVPALGEGRLLDPTDKRLDLVRFPADGLWESHALVLDPARPRLLEPASRPADGYRIQSRRQITPAGHDWRVEERLVLDGYFASWSRHVLARLAPVDRIRAVQDMLARAGDVQVLELALDNLDVLQEPLELALTYRVPNAISATGSRRSAALPAPWEDYYLATDFVPARRTAFEWPFRLVFESEVTVRLPSAASVLALDALHKHARSDSCAWTLAPTVAENAPGELKLRFEFEARPLAQPAERYAEFHDARAGVLRAWQTPLAWDE